MPGERAWAAALAEHREAVGELLERLRRVPPERWHAPAAAGKWSPAEEALHVALAYELGVTAAAGGPGMRPRVPRASAWLARTLLLPLLVRAGTFPRGAEAPDEVRPSRAEARGLTAAALAARLQRAADGAAAALREADGRRPPPRVAHAYFGPLRPLAVLRLLSAHTRHHARALARREEAGRGGA